MKYHIQKKYSTSSTKSHLKTMLLSAVLAIATFTGTGITMAKEITSGGNPAGGSTAVCSPVKSLSYKGDARVGETGLASIDINYSVSSCDKTVPVRVEVTLIQNIAGAEPLYVNDDALTSDRITVFGVQVGKSYIARVRVFNRNSGELIGSSQIFAAAVRKVGV